MSNWRTIETAPKGEWVVIWDSRSVTDMSQAYVARCFQWGAEGEEDWEGPFADGYLTSDLELKPTHWMPLPPPPCDSGSRAER